MFGKKRLKFWDTINIEKDMLRLFVKSSANNIGTRDYELQSKSIPIPSGPIIVSFCIIFPLLDFLSIGSFILSFLIILYCVHI